MFEAVFYETMEDGRLHCLLCPHSCLIAEGKAGLCGTRENHNGQLFARNYSQISSLSMDPVEKKPLYHYFPGHDILSVGTLGCNLHCRFCQNHPISQYYRHHNDTTTQQISPAELSKIVEDHQSFGVAYTYSEPIVWYEYVMDCSRLMHSRGIKNVLVTNGFIQPTPLRELLPTIDAMNIDLKAFTDQNYRALGGIKENILETIRICHQAGVHIELTTLVVTGFNDKLSELEALFKWVAELDPSIPLHLSRYHPSFQYTAPSTSAELMVSLVEKAREYLSYVYLGNMPGSQDSICPECGTTLISREYYHTHILALKPTDKGVCCTHCGKTVNFTLPPGTVHAGH